MGCTPPARSDAVLALPKVPLSFTTTFPGTSRTQVLATATCVEAWRELVLVVRVHQGFVGPDATLDVVAVAAAPTAEQPGIDYLAAELLASVSLAGVKTVTAGPLFRSRVLAPLPTHLQVQARVAQPPARTRIEAVLSIELSGKR